MYNRSFFLGSSRNQQPQFNSNYTSSHQYQLPFEQQSLSYQTYLYQMAFNASLPVLTLPPPVMDATSSHITYQAQRNSSNHNEQLLEDLSLFLADDNTNSEQEDIIVQQPALQRMKASAVAQLDSMLENLSIHEQIAVIKKFPQYKCLKIVNEITRNLYEFTGANKIEQLTLKELLILAKIFNLKEFAKKFATHRGIVNTKLTPIGLYWSNLRNLDTGCMESLLQLQECCIQTGNRDFLNKTVKYYDLIIKKERKISIDNLEPHLLDIIKAVAKNKKAYKAAIVLKVSDQWLSQSARVIITALLKKYPDVRELNSQLLDGNVYKILKSLCDCIYESEEFKAQLAASANESLASPIQTREARNLTVSSLNAEEQAQESDNEPDLLEDAIAYFLGDNQSLFDDTQTQVDEHLHDDNTVLFECALTQENAQHIPQTNTAIAQLPDCLNEDSSADFDANLDRLIAELEYLDGEEYNIEIARSYPAEFYQTRIYDPRIFASHASPKRGLLDTENFSPTKKVRQDRFNFN